MNEASHSVIDKTWRRFLIELELSRRYPECRIDFTGGHVKNPVLEKTLPSLLHIKSVAILDAALLAAIRTCDMSMPRRYPNSLRGRIDFMTDQGILLQAEHVKKIKYRRNDLAHEYEERIDWNELDCDVDRIQSVLEELGVARARPTFEPFSERSGAQDSSKPGVLAEYEHRFGLREQGKVVTEVKWIEYVLAE